MLFLFHLWPFCPHSSSQKKVSVGFWWHGTLDPYWYSVPPAEEVRRNFGAGVCQRAHEPWTIKVRSMCAKLSNRQVCLCAWGSQAPHAFWSRAQLLDNSLASSDCLYLCMCPCSHVVVEDGGLGVKDWIVGRGMDGGDLMSLAVAPQQWNVRSLFWGVCSANCSSARLTGLLSDGRFNPGGVEEEHQGRDTERGGWAALPVPGVLFRHL